MQVTRYDKRAQTMILANVDLHRVLWVRFPLDIPISPIHLQIVLQP